MNISELYLYIEEKLRGLKRPAVVGINGAITSGKTMLARELEVYLRSKGCKTQLLHIDDFHNPRRVRLRENSPEWYLENAVDTPRFCDLINEIREGPVNRVMQLFDMGIDEYTKKEKLETDLDTIVIVEGVLLFDDAMRGLFDYRIFLDITPEEILRRGRTRDVPLYGEAILEQYTGLFIPVEQLYESRCSPRELSHLVIDNNDVFNPVILRDIL